MVAVVSLAVVPLVGCGRAAPSSIELGQPSAATLRGQVLSSPSCPVERAEHPCPPRPVAGARVAVSRNGDVVATTTTDRRGNFSVPVPAGTLLVVAHNVGGYASQASRRLTLRHDSSVRVLLVVDSGIR